jgi:murein DD-endopeptidase MepM/ murein hydrolase activator NlpD
MNLISLLYPNLLPQSQFNLDKFENLSILLGSIEQVDGTMKPFQNALSWLFRASIASIKKHYPYNIVMAVFVVGCGLGYHMGKNDGIIIPVQLADTKISNEQLAPIDLVEDKESDEANNETECDRPQRSISVAELNFKTQESIHSKITRATDILRPTEKTLEVRGGDTLVSILTNEGIERRLAHDVVRSLRGHCDPRRLKPGQTVTLALKPSEEEDQGPELLKVSLKIDETKDVHSSRGDEGKFDAWLEQKEVKKELAYANGKIVNSLFAASTQAGVPATIVIDVIRALGHRVDLQRDIQPGDQFEIAYERFVDKTGKNVSDGKATFVFLHAKGKDIKLYRHTTKSGETDFYLEDGSNLKNGFMRTPIDGARLSSNFGMRKHPIHKFTRMHRGVDFAAPRGTPILAAGDGVITKMGWHGGYGRYIQVKHNGEFATAYAHMNRFATNLKVGAKVRQGQKIGEVGSTGSSTGCHLHYEILRHGQQINPKSVKNVGGKKLEGRELQHFLACIGATNTKVAELRNTETSKKIAHNGIANNDNKIPGNNPVNNLENKDINKNTTQALDQRLDPKLDKDLQPESHKQLASLADPTIPLSTQDGAANLNTSIQGPTDRHESNTTSSKDKGESSTSKSSGDTSHALDLALAEAQSVLNASSVAEPNIEAPHDTEAQRDASESSQPSLEVLKLAKPNPAQPA